jgi:hypothetical protein
MGVGRRVGAIEQPGEQEGEIVRLHAHRGRRAAQREASGPFGDRRGRFGSDQDQGAIERYAPERRPAVGDGPELDDRMHLRRGGPRHVRGECAQ